MAETLSSASQEVNTESLEITQESLAQKQDALLKISINRYSLKVQGIENQIKEINESRKENTGVIGGLGDWIGEKTGAYETGKEIYESQMKQTHERAKVLYEQIFAEFNGKILSPTEQANIEALIQKLEQVAETKLTEISWGKAVFNTAHIDEIHGDYGSLKNRAKIFAKTTIGLAEGGYEGVAGLVELGKIPIKATAIVAAFVSSSLSESSFSQGEFHSSVGEQISSDVLEIFSKLTLENAQKALAILPKALEVFSNASPDVQAEGFGKFFGMMLVPLGIGPKGVRFGKTLVNTGVTTMKNGVETASRVARVVAKQAKRAIWPSKNALKVAGKAGVAGTMAMALGAGTAAAGTATIIEGATVQMGGGNQKNSAEVVGAVLAGRAAETPVATLKNSWEHAEEMMRRDIAQAKIDPKSVPLIQLQIARKAIARWDATMQIPTEFITPYLQEVFRAKSAQLAKKTEAHSRVSPETGMKDANLPDAKKLMEAEKILKEKRFLEELWILDSKNPVLTNTALAKEIIEETNFTRLDKDSLTLIGKKIDGVTFDQEQQYIKLKQAVRNELEASMKDMRYLIKQKEIEQWLEKINRVNVLTIYKVMDNWTLTRVENLQTIVKTIEERRESIKSTMPTASSLTQSKYRQEMKELDILTKQTIHLLMSLQKTIKTNSSFSLSEKTSTILETALSKIWYIS